MLILQHQDTSYTSSETQCKEQTLPAQAQKNVIYIPSPVTQLPQSITAHSWLRITEELAHPSTLAGTPYCSW